jgi:thiosulfate dehydrogenase [quinone] large subunit
MKNRVSYSVPQLTALVLLRWLIGWHCLYEGIAKLLNPYWSSAPFLLESKGWFSEWFISLAANGSTLRFIDLLNEWGLIAIGLGLIFGLFTRLAALSGAVLLMMYYLANPPIPGIATNLPMEGNYLLVNKTLIEAAALLVLSFFPTGEQVGLDGFIHGARKEKKR